MTVRIDDRSLIILSQILIIRPSCSPQRYKPAMNLYQLSIALLFLYFLTAAGENPTNFPAEVSINCGSSGTLAALNGREWLGDVKPKFSSLLQIKGSSSTTSTVIRKFISTDPIPHRTARISRSKFSYEFQVSPGQKIIRFHFHPTTYRTFKGSWDLFTVESGPFTLLSNFSASLIANALGVNYFVKEFYLYIQENGQLNIGFSPSSLDAYAFINGIEIISVPAGLSYFNGGDIGVQVVGQKSLVYIDYNSVLEVIHRLSIKPSSVPSAGDFDGIFPTWATRKANKEKSSSWKIPVDMGFRYLIRLHFSELGLKIVETDDVIFKVLINGYTNIDIVKKRNDDNIPRYIDYIVMVRGNKKEGKRDRLISLQSYNEFIDGNGLLAGFEIFKLSNPDNSLASPKPPSQSQDSLPLVLVLRHRNVIATIAITIIALMNIFVHKLREIWEASSIEEKNKPLARAERHCRRFSFAEIQLATNNFSDALLIGKGGFGRVYKGLIDKGQKTVAVKRLKPSSKQGSHEFLTEIEMLSELRHVNLVSLIGYCNEHGEMILVYDYMAYGTLADHLYKLQRESNKCCSLTWKQRLDICIGAGRGLDYLHTGHGIIHRDVKASNFLLDENFIAKVLDFGLAKPEDRSKLKSYISTKVKGTFGYLDPYYFNTHKLTRKSDTYAFGVVLLEVLCGRPAVDSSVEENEHILSKWALDKIRKGEVAQIVASCLRDEISPNSLNTLVGVAERCLCEEPKNRPTMSQVVLQLESALVQQEHKEQIESGLEQQEHKEQLDSVLEQQEDKELVELNEIAGVSDDLHHCNEEFNPSAVDKGKETIAPPDEQHQNNSKVVNDEVLFGRTDGRKASIHRPNRLWPWDGFLNRVKPSKKNELISDGPKCLRIAEICEEISARDIKLAKFDWNTIAAATNKFSYSNQVGQGRLGTVYKAMLPKGQVVAVKRLPSCSAHVLKEFKNGILLLQNLQHPNIIKLLGYCFHKEEKLLVYEFMENKSLIETLRDEVQSRHFQWSVRFKIIMGIAQGLVYLHRDSRMKVIHKDLKTSNILLDAQMNPRISGFAYASSFVEHQPEPETTDIHGTYGYMAPEYCLYGRFSVKSDVYSFGIIVMELVSGRKIQRSDSRSMFLLDYAWKLWNEGKELGLVDESLQGAFAVEQAVRCIQIGLLCVQQQPDDRPEMPSVIKMLNGDELPGEPQEPWPRAQRKDSACSNIHTHGLDCDANVKLTKFDWDEIAAATNNFSSLNKVGVGGFGYVYKAMLPTGQIVAVKRLSPCSAQGFQELKNEILLLSNLQHQNIIKLLGYCIHREEQLLVYEFMENTSPGAIDKQQRSQHFRWPVRFKIIMGIARGLVYLHQDSGLRVIHRDLKPSNILLDIEMNPKISDFAFARTLKEYQSDLETMLACGTYGYMAPEYSTQGEFSIKSDVYSFGIVTLVIISGRRAFTPNQEAAFLHEWARKLWNEKEAWRLVDESLEGAFPVEEALRCLQVGLLCTQEKPYDRPTMGSVIKMLEGNELTVEPQEQWRRAPWEDSAITTVRTDGGVDSDATFEFDDTLER